MGSILKKLIGLLRSKRHRVRAKGTFVLPASPGTSCRPAEECLKERLRSGSVSTTTPYPSHWMNTNSLQLYDPYAALRSERHYRVSVTSNGSWSHTVSRTETPR